MMLKDKERTSDLISSDRVEGTAVFGADGDKIGNVQEMLIEKIGGQVTDVVISVGSFLGMGGELHSLPWSKFSYDTDLEGYKLDVTEDQLRKAPAFKQADRETAHDRDYQTTVYEYWQVPTYW
ncbi:MAG: PRC-barrel domain-containing protein [Parasphingopyxis sp.]|nr:PRC-barrel domain-containing protein [Sphingomonadales bacterium]